MTEQLTQALELVDVGAIRRTLEACREHRAGQPHVEQAWET
eukprot:COSAG01_NODE_51847_length_351_cov_1.031746_1_plen_40_part_01